jgi:hypothetical protein
MSYLCCLYEGSCLIYVVCACLRIVVSDKRQELLTRREHLGTSLVIVGGLASTWVHP